jgi:anti-sigma regulatory factor (Ser/Thr protein kinase)
MARDPDRSGDPRGGLAVPARSAAARTLRLPAELKAPARARAELRAFLAPDGLTSERLYDLQLIVTELVSNAVRHGSLAGDAVEIVFERLGGALHVSVIDAGRGLSPPVVRAQSTRRRSGRGLRAVQRLSDEWAAELRAGRCAVWVRAGLHTQPASGC